ncbi:MAG TPA: hypothetical protein VMH28_24685 [Candidatus Acidoferrales bacterium]|nr:hypothetical protein [Candidatus Acidoferrales bacterium]
MSSCWVGDASDRGVAQIHIVEDGGFLKVAMGIDETGGDGAAVEVDDARVLGRQRADGVVGADGDDLAVGDGDCLGDGIGAIDGEDAAVDEDVVGGRL